MKTSSLLTVLFLGAALVIGFTGCQHHKPLRTTPLFDPNAPTPKPPEPTRGAGRETPGGEPLTNPPPVNKDDVRPFNEHSRYAGTLKDGIEIREKFAADTVLFDFDSATIKKSEFSKLEDVANYFKGNTTDAVRIEGHCDERGTEKYNLSLGDRRALAVREYLANLGVDADRIGTVTYGAAKPVDAGHNESAWKKNRRGELILMQPKK